MTRFLSLCRSVDLLPRVDSSGAGSAPGDATPPVVDTLDDYGSSGSMPLFVRGGAGTETVMSRSHGELPGSHFPPSKGPLRQRSSIMHMLIRCAWQRRHRDRDEPLARGGFASCKPCPLCSQMTTLRALTCRGFVSSVQRQHSVSPKARAVAVLTRQRLRTGRAGLHTAARPAAAAARRAERRLRRRWR